MQRRKEPMEETQTRVRFPMTWHEARAAQARYAIANNLPLTLFVPLNGPIQLQLQLIPPGEFLMGSAPAIWERSDREGPRHRVEIEVPFYMGKVPVTQAQWQAVVGENPAFFEGPGTLPVEMVSWVECVAFCESLSHTTGRIVRLPTEAEWEYACRAGSDSVFNFGDDWQALPDHAWYRDNASGCAHPVGLKQANAWGLHDMHGGIDEYCLDSWHPTYQGAPSDGRAWRDEGAPDLRVLRGGSWYDEGRFCRSPHRNYYHYDTPSEDHGLRVLVDVQECHSGPKLPPA